MKVENSIYLAADSKLAGSVIFKKLTPAELKSPVYRKSCNFNLTNQFALQNNFEERKSPFVFPVAAMPWVIINNIYAADFLNNALAITSDGICSGHNNVNKLLLFTSGVNMPPCIRKSVRDPKNLLMHKCKATCIVNQKN